MLKTNRSHLMITIVMIKRDITITITIAVALIANTILSVRFAMYKADNER